MAFPIVLWGGRLPLGQGSTAGVPAGLPGRVEGGVQLRDGFFEGLAPDADATRVLSEPDAPWLIVGLEDLA